MNVVVAGLDHGQADAVDGDRALVDEVRREVARHRDRHDVPVLARVAAYDVPDGVDVALDQVPAETGAGRDRALEVDPVAGSQRAEAGLGRGSRPSRRRSTSSSVALGHGQAARR